MNVVEIDKPIKARALKLLDEHASSRSLRTLDSLQPASAIISDDNLSINCFIAADQRLPDVAKIYFQSFYPSKNNETTK